ncbi:MAG: class I SAM-dependent methyltransferase, partial [Ignavibacteria bacterium]|nr:class I SAM-dependent methyltransferase [Ignavibacteria bacterium]
NRRAIQSIISRYFERGTRILEINCGTGTDAIALARQGVHVLATDVSSAMIARVEKKVRDQDLTAFVHTRQLAFEQLDLLESGTFDGCLSNLGGLNCAMSLAPVARQVSRVTKPGSCIIAVVMNRWSVWEMVSFLLRGNVRGAFRRAKGEALAKIGEHVIRVQYYSPSAFVGCFQPWFSPVEITGINIFTPSPGSTVANSLLRPLLPALRQLERVLSLHYPFNCMGDHFCAVLRRTGE